MYEHKLYIPKTVSYEVAQRIIGIFQLNYKGFNMSRIEGYWDGEWETVDVITVIDNKFSIEDIGEIIGMMKQDGEETVLITHQEITARFV